MNPKNKNNKPEAVAEQPVSISAAAAKAKSTIPDMTVSMLLKLVGKEGKEDSLKSELVRRRARLSAVCSKPSNLPESGLEYKSAQAQRLEVQRQLQGYGDLIAQQREFLHALFVMNTTSSLVIQIEGRDIERTVDSWVSRRDLEIPELEALYAHGLADCAVPRGTVQVEIAADGSRREVVVSVSRFYDLRADRTDKVDALVVEKRVIDNALNVWNTNTVVPRELLPRYYQTAGA